MTLLSHLAQTDKVLIFFALIPIIYIFKSIFLKNASYFRSIFYIFLYPGVILHELSHLLFCFLTFARVKKVKLFSSTGGFVEYENPKIPIIGNFLVSVAPFILGSIVIFYLSKIMNVDFVSFISSAKYYVYLYLCVTILITLFPSSQDFKNAPFIFLFAILVAFLYLYSLASPQVQDIFFKVSIFSTLLLLGANTIAYSARKLRWK